MPESQSVYAYGDLPFNPVTTGQSTASLKIVMVVKQLDVMLMPDLHAVKDVYLADGLDGFIGQPIGLFGPVPSGTVQWCILEDDDGMKVIMFMEFPKKLLLRCC
eukprot:4450012-Amphidinium_carterae.1